MLKLKPLTIDWLVVGAHIPPVIFIVPRNVNSSTRTCIRLLGPCFKTGQKKYHHQNFHQRQATPWEVAHLRLATTTQDAAQRCNHSNTWTPLHHAHWHQLHDSWYAKADTLRKQTFVKTAQCVQTGQQHAHKAIWLSSINFICFPFNKFRHF